MKPYFQTDSGTIFHGTALDVLKFLPDESVHCCVTSPPYWGLRAYGTEPQTWDGDPNCEHQWVDTSWKDTRKNDDTAGSKQRTNAGSVGDRVDRNCDTCQLCGAWRGELGLEPTPELYTQHIVQIFREVRRVLRDDGTCWVNIGDSYCANKTGSVNDSVSTLGGGKETQTVACNRPNKTGDGLKPKDLVGIPWMVAFALRADGWYLRQDIIWHKPNPMPESVKDRCTKSHEYIFLLSKSQRYFYDHEAIKDPNQPDGRKDTQFKGSSKYENGFGPGASMSTKRGHERWPVGGRNKRSVWTVSTRPFSGAHFAVFPPDLIEPCVLAGCPKGGTVLDPFMGSGTTAIVAHRYDRKFIGIELNQKYLDEITIPRITAETQQMKLFSA